jgi:tetratricopeptide (TPR) repeat protein
MAIKGSLKEASLPDVLQLLAMGKKTGCLAVTHRSNFGYIFFEKGRICYASIVNRRDRLGDMLVKNSVISQEQLENAIAAQTRLRDKRIGELLVEQNALSREELHQYVRRQIEEAVYFLFTWMQGTFNFEADVHPEEQDLLVSINPESLLLEGARRMDEWNLVEKKIPSFDLVFEADHARVKASDVEVTEEQRVVLDLVDGQRDVQAIVDDSGLVEFEVGKALYGLLTAGFVHRVGRTKATADPQVSETRIEEHRNLGIAFYKTGMLDEALRELRRVLELRSGDASARFFIGVALARQGRWAEATTVLKEAAAQPGARYAVLHNLAYVLERQGRYAEAQAALEDGARRGGAADPRAQTSMGIVALLAGDVAHADSALGAARPLFGTRPPTAAWFHYAALTAALLGDHQRAADLLNEGIAAHPHAAALYNNLAVVHERRARYDDALAMIEKGIQEDPGLAQLQKNLGDLLYRVGRYDEAFEAYQRAVKNNPDIGGDVYLKLGNIRFRRQDRDEAVRCWERALELDPENAIVQKNLESVRQVLQ